ncbi:MAG: cytochrome P460 family protein, partial [Minwuiales bacterium]|nr:cytochrome P460 family protein [Minwuiales bacterium]
AEITNAEARAVYDCLLDEMVAGYRKSGDQTAELYKGWKTFNTVPYQSGTHGNRYVNNYANAVAEVNYGKYEDVGRMPVGSVLAKDSFVVMGNGRTAAGPLFIMEKAFAGFSPETDNWKYSMVMPDGTVFGQTGGKGANNVAFCHQCHVAVAEDQDALFFLPDELRK